MRYWFLSWLLLGFLAAGQGWLGWFLGLSLIVVVLLLGALFQGGRVMLRQVKRKP